MQKLAVRQVNIPTSTQLVQKEVNMEHVQCLTSKLFSELTSQQRDKATEFIRCNANAFSGECPFSRSEFDPRRTHLVEHSIETVGSRHPVRQALRRHPVAYLLEIDDYVQQLQDHGIVEPRSGSEWISNIVLLRKKDSIFAIV